ncbi:MAG: cyclic lactone autoinducer peptide [Christensenellaceae bacterium]
MNKWQRFFTKNILSLVTSTAFLFILSNINTTCCGPGHQPTLPDAARKLNRFENDKENS